MACIAFVGVARELSIKIRQAVGGYLRPAEAFYYSFGGYFNEKSTETAVVLCTLCGLVGGLSAYCMVADSGTVGTDREDRLEWAFSNVNSFMSDEM